VKPVKSRVKPHLFVPDPDVPVDQDGRHYCRDCGVAERDGDQRHTLPPAGDAQDEHRRRAGESGS
jgi:hypothetical protein